jgi:hypothetical protein
VGESLKLAFPGQGEDAECLDSLLQRHTVFTLSLHPDFDFHARCQPLLTPSLLLFLDEIRRIEYVDWQREARMVLSKVRPGRFSRCCLCVLPVLCFALGCSILPTAASSPLCSLHPQDVAELKAESRRTRKCSVVTITRSDVTLDQKDGKSTKRAEVR